MKASNQCILVLSLYSYVFTIAVGIAQLAGVLRTNHLGIEMILVAVAQAIIAIISVVTGREKRNEEQKHKVSDND